MHRMGNATFTSKIQLLSNSKTLPILPIEPPQLATLTDFSSRLNDSNPRPLGEAIMILCSNLGDANRNS